MTKIVFLLILTILCDILFAKELLFYNLPKVSSFVNIRNTDVVMQKFDYSCGSASLATILRYFYNQNIEEADILNFLLQDSQNLKVEKDNIMFSFADLANFAYSQEFKTISLKLDIQTLQTLQKLKVPAIVYVKIRNEEHFTVFKKIVNNKVFLADSTFGNLTVSLLQFREMFEDGQQYGNILIVIPKHKAIIPNYSFLNTIETKPLIFKTHTGFLF